MTAIRTTGFFALSLLGALAVSAGTTTRNFADYRNASVADFPVPLVLDAGVDGLTFADAAADGSDVRVLDSDGAVLPVEVDQWNPAGRSVVWAKVPAFSKDTVLTVKWGAAAAGLEPSTDSVWDDSELVMHLSDGRDSSRHGATLTRADDAVADGPLGAAAAFGTTDRRYVGDLKPGQIGGLSNAFTISFWLDSANMGAEDNYVFYANLNGQFAVLHGYKRRHLELFFYGLVLNGESPRNASAIQIPDVGWHHYAWTYDGATLKAWCDGALVRATSVSFTLRGSTASVPFYLGGPASAAKYLNGSLDEVRVESVARSAAWIAASCETQARTLPPYNFEYELPALETDETLTNFTALVSVNSATPGWSEAFHSAAQNNRLFFRTELDGADCDFEVERIPRSRTVPMTWWVRIPFYRGHQKIHLCWPRFSSPAGPAFDYSNTNAWDSSYLHVFHLAPVPENRRDSARRCDMKPETWSNYNASADGPTGQSLAALTTSNVYTRIGFSAVQPPALTNRYTISFWARKDDFHNPKNAYVLAYTGSSIPGVQSSLIAGYGRSPNAFRFFNAVGYNSADMELPIPDDGWHHYAITSDGVAIKGWRDGELVVTSSAVFDFACSFKGVTGWFGNSSKDMNGFMGAFDEFRIAYEPRSREWIRTCYRNQFVYRHGVPRLGQPAFADDVSSAATENSLAFACDLVCQKSSEMTFCWGASDGGEDMARWENARQMGTRAEGALTAELDDLADDERVCARFFATNACGCAWSRPIWGRAPFAGRRAYARIRFSGYDGGTSLTNFPACVRLPTRLGLPASSDIVRFSAADGTPMPFEVESWNPSGDSIVWVRVPELTSATELTISWQGFDATGDISAGGNVWNSDYLRVYHFASGRESSIYAAHPFANDWAASTEAESPSGNGRRFDGQGTLRLANARFLDFAEGMTLQTWAKIENTDSTYLALAGGVGQLGFISGFKGDAIELFAYEPSPTPSRYAQQEALRGFSRIPRPDDGWHHYAYTYNGREFASYLDGERMTNVAFHAAFGSSPGDNRDVDLTCHLGASPSGAHNLTGALDEFRVEKTGRSADWIRACWKNQSDSSFCVVGPVCNRGLVFVIR